MPPAASPEICPTCGAKPSLNRRPKGPDPVVRAFVEARCIPDPDARTSSADLWDALIAFCENQGHRLCSQRSLGLSLGTNPMLRHVRLPGGRRAWIGIRLLPAPVDSTPAP